MSDSALFVPGVANDGRYDASTMRHFVQYIVRGRAGVWPSTSGIVSQHAGTPGMSVDVAGPFIAAVTGSAVANQGSYLQEISATVSNKAIGTANGSNPRNDIIGIQIQDSAISGSSANDTNEANALQVIPGTPAGSPVDPTLPANFLSLARIRVRTSTTSILNSDITDLRSFAVLSDLVNTQIARATMTATTAFPNGVATVVNLDNEDYDDHTDFNVSTFTYVVPASGLYEVGGKVIFGYNNAQQNGALWIYDNGSPKELLSETTVGAGISTNSPLTCTGVEQLKLTSGHSITWVFIPLGSASNAVQVTSASGWIRRLS